MFQLSIFVVSEAHAQLSGTPHPPDPPADVDVLILEGELLISLRWWFDNKKLFRVAVKFSVDVPACRCC